MTSYIAPAIWLGLGLFGMLIWPRTVTPAYLGKSTDEKLADLRRTFNSRLHLLFTGVLGVLSLSATVRSVWNGAPSWWLWLLATGAIIASMVARERAAVRFFELTGESRGHRHAQESRRQRYLWAFAVVGVAAFLISKIVMPDPDADPVDSVRAIVGLLCLIIAALAALGAGWSTVWVFRDIGNDR